jgi:hypothetical protein
MELRSILHEYGAHRKSRRATKLTTATFGDHFKWPPGTGSAKTGRLWT